MSAWTEILRRAIEASPRGIAGVAEELGVSRAALSLVHAGKYPARPDRIAARVIDVFERHECPHTAMQVRNADCARRALTAAPTSSPRDMRQWRACQACPHKPQGAPHANP